MSDRAILVDDRVGSRELLPLLKRLHYPVKLERLEFADVAFDGNGPRGSVRVGIERKTIQDLINSMTSGRLTTHQLPGLVQTYDYRWILVEGIYRPSRDNLIEVWRHGGWQVAPTRLAYSQLAGYVLSLEVQGGCRRMRTMSLGETAIEVGLMFRWWGKQWSKHKSHMKLEKDLSTARVLHSRPSYPMRFAGIFDGIDWIKAKAIAKHFHTIEAMVEAGPDEWQKVVGIGRKLGTVVPQIIRGIGGRGLEGSREE